MSSSNGRGVPGAATTFSKDGDQRAAGSFGDAASTPSQPAGDVETRGGGHHDEDSATVSSPPSSIERRERGEESYKVGKQQSPAMSGNTSCQAHGYSRKPTSEPNSDFGDESEAVSAVALLLLAASATSHGTLAGVFEGGGEGVSPNGSHVAEIPSSSWWSSSSSSSSPSSADTVSDTTDARLYNTIQDVAAASPAAGFHPLRTRDAWSTQAPRSSFAHTVSYGGAAAARQPACPGGNGGRWASGHRHSGGQAGCGSGDWTCGAESGGKFVSSDRRGESQAQEARVMFFPSANDESSRPLSSISATLEEEGWTQYGRSSNEHPTGAPAAAARATEDQRSFLNHTYGGPPCSALSGSGSNSHGTRSNDGRDYRHEAPTSPIPTAGVERGRQLCCAGGGGAHDFGGVVTEGMGSNRAGGFEAQQPPSRLPPPAPSSSATGAPLRAQAPWRRVDQPTKTLGAAASVPVRTGAGYPTSVTALRSPRGKRSPSPPRIAGRKKPEGYRSYSTWEGAGRARKASGGGGGAGSGGGGGGPRRWTSYSIGGVGRGNSSSVVKVNGGGNGSGGRVVETGEGSSDRDFQLQRRQQQQQPGGVKHGLLGWSRKRSRVAGEEELEGEEEDGREVLQPYSTQASVGLVQWRNERAAPRAAALVVPAASAAAGVDPRDETTIDDSKVIGGSRPRAMDLDLEAPGASFSAAFNKGITGHAGRPSPRKKSKNLVWSQFRKACDRCTDKKVRCDGSNPTGGFKACTPCKKAGVSCLFGICRRSGPRDENGHKTAAAGVIMKRNHFEKVTERLGQCRTAACRFVNEDGSFWREHFHCRVGNCSFAGKNMSELLLHRGEDHPEFPEAGGSSTLAAFCSDESSAAVIPSSLLKEVAIPYQRGIC